MNILILCTYYPPDTAVAAVRPYMLAKYLNKLGHRVTVIRSGEFYHKPDKNLTYEDDDIRVYSFLGENSPAERFLRGELEENAVSTERKKLSFLPDIIRKPLAFVYRMLTDPANIGAAQAKAKIQQEFIDSLEEKNFDIVFATYSNLENTYSGVYAAEKFGCKYILDFRDLIAQKTIQSPIEFFFKSRIQKKVIAKANACTTVSEGLSEEIRKQFPEKKIFTLYNGYEKNDLDITDLTEEKKLSFCYTGDLYGGVRDASPIFKALRRLRDDGKINTENISFHYAGNGFEDIVKQASPFGMTDILVNHGYVNKGEAERIQCSSDFFVVLSWNTKHAKGILTGKFYESLKNKKPVIACISGDEPQSELRNIITEYNLGVCFEEADGAATEQMLYDYISEQYNRKMNGSKVAYEPKQDVFDKFEYSGTAKQLEAIMKELTPK